MSSNYWTKLANAIAANPYIEKDVDACLHRTMHMREYATEIAAKYNATTQTWRATRDWHEKVTQLEAKATAQYEDMTLNKAKLEKARADK